MAVASLDSSRRKGRPIGKTASWSTGEGTRWWKRPEIWLWSFILLIETQPFEILASGGDPAGGGAGSGSHLSQYVREGLGIIAFSALFWRPGPPKAPFLKLCLPFAGFCFYAFLVSLVNPDPVWSIKTLAVYITAAGATLAMAFRLRPIDFCRVLALVMIASCILSLITVFAMPSLGVTNASVSAGVDDVGGWRGIYAHKNLLGHVAGITFGLMLLTGRPIFRDNRLWGVALAFSLVCAVGSKSSTALILSAALPAIYLAAVRPKGIARYVSVFLTSLLFLAAIFLRDYIVQAILGMLGKNSSLSGRTDIWGYAAQYIKDHLIFGGGFGMTASVEFHQTLKAFFGVEYTHNQYLDVLVNTGVIGMALLLAVVIHAAWSAWRRPVSQSSSEARDFLSVLLLGWVISGWSETSNAVLGQVYFAAIFGLLGVSVSAGRLTRPGFQRRGVSPSSVAKSAVTN